MQSSQCEALRADAAHKETWAGRALQSPGPGLSPEPPQLRRTLASFLLFCSKYFLVVGGHKIFILCGAQDPTQCPTRARRVAPAPFYFRLKDVRFFKKVENHTSVPRLSGPECAVQPSLWLQMFPSPKNGPAPPVVFPRPLPQRGRPLICLLSPRFPFLDITHQGILPCVATVSGFFHVTYL